jgi:hypothetical protein
LAFHDLVRFFRRRGPAVFFRKPGPSARLAEERLVRRHFLIGFFVMLAVVGWHPHARINNAGTQMNVQPTDAPRENLAPLIK